MSGAALASEPSSLGTERRIMLAAIAYSAGAMWFSPEAYWALLRQYMRAHFYLLPPMLLVGLITAALIAKPTAPHSFLLGLLRRRAFGGSLIVGTFCVGIAAFSTYKHHIPTLVPFFADKPLAALDALIHHGDPWRYVHLVFPSGAENELAFLYGPGWFTEWLGVFLFAAFLPANALRVRYIASFAYTLLILGTLLRVAGASAGPIFFDRMFGGDRFADLISALEAGSGGVHMLAASDYLFAAYRSDDAVFGSGISAMPSIHVAMAVLNALFLSKVNRIIGGAAWAFAGAILFGSVYFGWHYALDGYVSIVGVVVIWSAMGRALVDDPVSYRGTPRPER